MCSYDRSSCLTAHSHQSQLFLETRWKDGITTNGNNLKFNPPLKELLKNLKGHTKQRSCLKILKVTQNWKTRLDKEFNLTTLNIKWAFHTGECLSRMSDIIRVLCWLFVSLKESNPDKSTPGVWEAGCGALSWGRVVEPLRRFVSGLNVIYSFTYMKSVSRAWERSGRGIVAPPIWMKNEWWKQYLRAIWWVYHEVNELTVSRVAHFSLSTGNIITFSSIIQKNSLPLLKN